MKTFFMMSAFTLAANSWTWTEGNSIFKPDSTALLMVNRDDGILRDGAGKDLAEFPLDEQVMKLCAGLEFSFKMKFKKCGGFP